MQSNIHTQGPWEAKLYSNTNKCFVSANDSIIYEEVTSDSNTISANARLIAAAPDMLKALEHLEKELCPGEFVKHSQDAISKIKAAIKKARGE